MTQYDLNLREYWRIIKKRRWIILFTVILTGSFSTLFALLNKPVPLYKSTASVRLERVMLSGGGIYQEAMPWTNPDLLTTQTAVIRSHGIVEQAAKKLGMIPANLTSEEVRANKEYLATVLNLRSLVDSDFEQQMGVINIHVKSVDPRLAMRLANTLAEVYREERITDGNKRSVSQKGFIEAQLNQAREKLKASEEAAKAYREQNKLVSIDAESSGMVTKLQALQASYDKALVNAQKVAEIRRILDRAEVDAAGIQDEFLSRGRAGHVQVLQREARPAHARARHPAEDLHGALPPGGRDPQADRRDHRHHEGTAGRLRYEPERGHP